MITVYGSTSRRCHPQASLLGRQGVGQAEKAQGRAHSDPERRPAGERQTRGGSAGERQTRGGPAGERQTRDGPAGERQRERERERGRERQSGVVHRCSAC